MRGRGVLAGGTVALLATLCLAVGGWQVVRLRAASEAGPLAVVVEPPSSMDARAEGTLEITDACVLLRGPGAVTTLPIFLWQHATWDPTARTIEIDDEHGGHLLLRDGDPAALTGGGGEFATLEDEMLLWVRQPTAECAADRWFLTFGASGPGD